MWSEGWCWNGTGGRSGRIIGILVVVVFSFSVSFLSPVRLGIPEVSTVRAVSRFCSVEMSYQQSWKDQRGTYQSSYQRYQGSGFKPSYSRYRQGWGSQAQGLQPGPAMRLEIVQGIGNVKSASQQEEWDWRSCQKSKKGKKRRKSKRDSSSSGTESSSSSSESSSGKKGRKKERKKEKKDKKNKKSRKRSRSRSKSPQDDEEKRALRATYARSQLQLKVLRELQGAVREGGAQTGTAGNGARKARGRSADHPGGTNQ